MDITEPEELELNAQEKEKLIDKSLKAYSKGEKLVFNRKFNKAEKFFKKAFNNFMQLGEKKRAEKVLLKLAECFLIEGQYQNASSSMRDSANLRLLDYKFINAIEQYQSVIELVFKLGEEKDYSQNLLEIFSFISLCYLAVGDFQKSIDYLKKNIQKYAGNIKNVSKIKILNHATKLNNLIIKRDLEELEDIKSEKSKIDLREGEKLLLDRVYDILNVYINSDIILKADKSEIRAGDEFNITGKLDSGPDIVIKSLNILLDHGFSLIDKPKILDNKREFTFGLESKISGKFRIKPELICESEHFSFPLSSNKIIEIKPGYPVIQFITDMENLMINLEEPFSVTYAIKNIGRGEAINLKLEIETTPAIQLTEGTLTKQLHSLLPQEEFAFVYNFKGTIMGKHSIKSKLTFEGANAPDSFKNIEKELNIQINA